MLGAGAHEHNDETAHPLPICGTIQLDDRIHDHHMVVLVESARDLAQQLVHHRIRRRHRSDERKIDTAGCDGAAKGSRFATTACTRAWQTTRERQRRDGIVTVKILDLTTLRGFNW